MKKTKVCFEYKYFPTPIYYCYIKNRKKHSAILRHNKCYLFFLKCVKIIENQKKKKKWF